MNRDIGQECCDVTDNLPVNWKIYWSRTVPDVCYLVTETNVIRFQNMNDLEDYVDRIEDEETLAVIAEAEASDYGN